MRKLVRRATGVPHQTGAGFDHDRRLRVRGDVHSDLPCGNAEPGDRRVALRGWSDEYRLCAQTVQPGGHLRLGQGGIQWSHHQPGGCRAQQRDDELDGVGADEADRVTSAQAGAAQTVGHVVDQRAKGAV